MDASKREMASELSKIEFKENVWAKTSGLEEVGAQLPQEDSRRN